MNLRTASSRDLLQFVAEDDVCLGVVAIDETESPIADVEGLEQGANRGDANSARDQQDRRTGSAQGRHGAGGAFGEDEGAGPNGVDEAAAVAECFYGDPKHVTVSWSRQGKRVS